MISRTVFANDFGVLFEIFSLVGLSMRIFEG